jgi:hypothetical protein
MSALEQDGHEVFGRFEQAVPGYELGRFGAGQGDGGMQSVGKFGL